MTLPTSGPISIAQIAAEFGLPASTPFPGGFYGQGGASSSGALSFADFYGRSATPVGPPPPPAPTFTPDGGNVDSSDFGSSTVTLTCSDAAVWTFTGGGARGTASISNGGSAKSISFQVTNAQPDKFGNSATTTRSWTVTGTVGALERTFHVTVTAQGNDGTA